MKKKGQTLWWRVTFIDDITDNINPTVKYIHKYANGKNFSIYSEGIINGIIMRLKKTNCTVTWYFYWRSYWWNNFVGIFQWLWELFPFSLTLFTVFITYGYTNGICSSVYSSDYDNCSLLNVLIINILLTVYFLSKGITDRMKSHW